jgi:hypothetical protein
MTSNAGSSASGGGGGGRQKKRARVDVDEHHQATEVQLEVRTLLSEGFGRSSSLDRLFSHRIRVVGASAADGSRTFLEALQLPNGIVLLRAPFALDCSALTFDAALHCDNISGKKKKQAVVVAQGSVVVSGTLRDQTVVTLLSPVKVVRTLVISSYI